MTTRSMLALPVLLAAVVRLPAQQTPPAARYEISIGISGNGGPEDSFNPLTVLYRRWPRAGAQVLGFINYAQPRTAAEIAAAAALSDSAASALLAALDTCGLVRHDTAGYRVTFAVFDDSVWRAFDPVMATIAGRIDARVEAEILPQLLALYPRTRLAAAGVPFAVAAPVVVGSFGLDEWAVNELQRRDLVRVRAPHPGGRAYGVLAQSNHSAPRGAMWGIHGFQKGGVFFGNFGDNGPMNALRAQIRTLPDLAWAWRATGAKPPESVDRLTAALAELAARSGDDAFGPAARPDSERLLFEDLRAAGLVEEAAPGAYRLTFPVFVASDWQLLQPLVERVGHIAVDAFVAAGPELAAAYAGTAPAANGVPIAEALDLVYHHSYTRAFSDLLRRHPELAFTHEEGALRYTGYAVVR